MFFIHFAASLYFLLLLNAILASDEQLYDVVGQNIVYSEDSWALQLLNGTKLRFDLSNNFYLVRDEPHTVDGREIKFFGIIFLI